MAVLSSGMDSFKSCWCKVCLWVQKQPRWNISCTSNASSWRMVNSWRIYCSIRLSCMHPWSSRKLGPLCITSQPRPHRTRRKPTGFPKASRLHDISVFPQGALPMILSSIIIQNISIEPYSISLCRFPIRNVFFPTSYNWEYRYKTSNKITI